jgi:hypothetical protein
MRTLNWPLNVREAKGSGGTSPLFSMSATTSATSSVMPTSAWTAVWARWLRDGNSAHRPTNRPSSSDRVARYVYRSGQPASAAAPQLAARHLGGHGTPLGRGLGLSRHHRFDSFLVLPAGSSERAPLVVQAGRGGHRGICGRTTRSSRRRRRRATEGSAERPPHPRRDPSPHPIGPAITWQEPHLRPVSFISSPTQQIGKQKRSSPKKTTHPLVLIFEIGKVIPPQWRQVGTMWPCACGTVIGIGAP